MEFDPRNPIVQLLLQGMAMEDKGDMEGASTLFQRAWNDATHDFEKYLAAHYVARVQQRPVDKLHWLETALQLALSIDSPAASSALPALYKSLAKANEEAGDIDGAKKYTVLADKHNAQPTDDGPFYHGTKADLPVGDLLVAGKSSNYQQDLIMNHIYFTAMANGAGLAASLAKGDGRERVYIVEPTGPFEHDPNVTDKKFPGNPTRSYRTTEPLKIVGKVTDWAKQSAQQIQQWREKLDKNKGEIIN